MRADYAGVTTGVFIHSLQICHHLGRKGEIGDGIIDEGTLTCSWTDGGVAPHSAATGVDIQLGRSTKWVHSL